jgi:hypothetical protein
VLSHIDGGVKIISELQSTSNSNSPTANSSVLTISPIPYVHLRTLNLIFIRLDEQATMLAYNRDRQLLSEALDDAASGYNSEVPLAFSSLEEARNALDHIRTFGIRFLRSIYTKGTTPPYSEKVKLSLQLLRSVCLMRLKQWSSAFQFLTQSNSNSIQNKTEAGIMLLKMHRIFMGVSLSVDHERALTDEMVWDEYVHQFEAMVTHATSIIEKHASSTPSRTRQRQSTFSLDTGIIFLLYMVSVKCRDSRIRRLAIQLMKASDRQESVWNSELTARVAERVIAIEEEGLGLGGYGTNFKFLKPSEIPGSNRITGVEITWELEEKRARLRYCKIGSDAGEMRGVFEERLEW